MSQIMISLVTGEPLGQPYIHRSAWGSCAPAGMVRNAATVKTHAA